MAGTTGKGPNTMVEEISAPHSGDAHNQRLCEMEARLKETEAELLKKDRMVQELTQRLSQTAERLDRFQRMGSDRTVVSTSAFPKEVVEQQTELVADLQRAVQMWEDMQISCGLGRLEMQVSDLQMLFEEHFREDEPEENVEESAEPVVDEEAATTSEEAVEESGAEAVADAELDLPGETEAELESASKAEEEWEFLLSEDEECPLRPPEILNLAEADEESLRKCVANQDAYIDHLSARLQRTAERKTAVDWDVLAEEPEKLAKMLEHTVTRLQQGRHFTEFELTLQRTRLQRKERNLKMLSEALEVQMQSIHQNSPANPTDSTAGGRRWMRMLGMGKNEN